MIVGVEPVEGLLVHFADDAVREFAFVCGVVIHSKWTIGSHELGHASVVLIRYFLTVEGLLDLSDVGTAW